MTLYRFLSLEINEQADCVWRGQFITSREENDTHILLYALDDFYAEVFYDTQQNKITYIKGFRANSHLLPYKSMISFSGQLD